MEGWKRSKHWYSGGNVSNDGRMGKEVNHKKDNGHTCEPKKQEAYVYKSKSWYVRRNSWNYYFVIIWSLGIECSEALRSKGSSNEVFVCLWDKN